MNRISTKTALASVVALALFLAPTVLATPPTIARIVEGISTGKVRVSMKKSAVLAAFGKPAWCFHAAGPDDQECDWLAPPDKKIKGLPEPQHSIGGNRARILGRRGASRVHENVPLLSEWKTSFNFTTAGVFEIGIAQIAPQPS